MEAFYLSAKVYWKIKAKELGKLPTFYCGCEDNSNIRFVVFGALFLDVCLVYLNFQLVFDL